MRGWMFPCSELFPFFHGGRARPGRGRPVRWGRARRRGRVPGVGVACRAAVLFPFRRGGPFSRGCSVFGAVSVFRRPPRALSAVRPASFPAPAPLSPAHRPPPSAPHPQPRARPPWVVPCSGQFPFFFPRTAFRDRPSPFFRPGSGVFRPGSGVFRPGSGFSSLGAFSFVPGRVSFVPVCRAGVLCCLCVCSERTHRATPVKYYGG